MNNSTWTGCIWYQTTGRDMVFYLAYNIITPTHFFLGVFGHTLCLIAYFQRTRKQNAYMYQILITFSEIIEVTTLTLSIVISAYLSGRLGPGRIWYMSNYFCMWLAGRIILPIVNSAMTAASLFSVVMVADRVYALTKPMEYKCANHKAHQIIATVACSSISILTSIFDTFRFNIVENGNGPGLYKLVTNSGFTGTKTATGLTHLRNIIRIFSAVALVVCNFVLVYTYNKRLRKVGAMTNKSVKEMRMKKDERMLTFLAIFQSCSNAIAMGSMISIHIIIFVTPSVYDCTGAFMGPITDILAMVSSIADFYLLVAVSENFRGIVMAGLKALKNGAASVTNFSQGPNGQNLSGVNKTQTPRVSVRESGPNIVVTGLGAGGSGNTK